MSINTCDRCDRELKDPNAKYGWRCEKLMGGGTIYYPKRSSAKAPVTDGGGQSNGKTAADSSPVEYLSREEKYLIFAKEFILEAVWITIRNSGGSIWHLPEYVEQANGILSTLKALFTGEILPADVIVAMMENVVEGIGGDAYFVLAHLEWYNPSTELTKAQVTELAKRTARAWEEGAQLAIILHSAVKHAMARKAGAAVEGKGNYDAAKSANWKKPDGSTWWPDNGGFVEPPTKTTLQPGTRIDRYGNTSGKFASPVGTPYGQRSLAPGSQNSPYNSYEVIKPFDVNAGTTAPWFDQPGGGTQYHLPMSIQELRDLGYIRIITK